MSQLTGTVRTEGVVLHRDALSKILAYLDLENFLESRLVCKAWDNAARHTSSQWVELLSLRGPKEIRGNHLPDGYFGACRINAKTGLCCLKKHYEQQPRFQGQGSYFQAITHFGRSKKQRLQARVSSWKRPRLIIDASDSDHIKQWKELANERHAPRRQAKLDSLQALLDETKLHFEKFQESQGESQGSQGSSAKKTTRKRKK